MIGLRPVGAEIHHKRRNCVFGGLPVGVCLLHFIDDGSRRPGAYLIKGGAQIPEGGALALVQLLKLGFPVARRCHAGHFSCRTDKM